jgi:protein-S-isoprenylcysteine O-methyltransferase Ste14
MLAPLGPTGSPRSPPADRRLGSRDPQRSLWFKMDRRMGRLRAGAGSLVFLVLAPGVVAGVIPWLLTGWAVHDWLPLVRVLGGLLLGVGLAVLVEAFVRFVVEGIGTPAPVAPTERLVVGGAYRYVRNPMYLAVAALIVGQALILGQPVLLLYAAAFGVAVAVFVHGYEEPVLSRRFGAQYEAYRRAVPAWRPRRTPWRVGPPGGQDAQR